MLIYDDPVKFVDQTNVPERNIIRTLGRHLVISNTVITTVFC